MSLVVCANQEQDGATLRNESSIYEAYSFRNTLSSTYKIPKNAQVALQSCKVNVDGRVVFSKNQHRFSQFLDYAPLSRDGTSPKQSESTSAPVMVSLQGPNDDSDDVEELSINDFANHVQDRLRGTSFHPNYKGLAECSVKRNASSLDFLGFKFSVDSASSASNTNRVPANDTFENAYSETYDDSDSFSYTGGIFTRTIESALFPAIAICPSEPLSLADGVFKVNISGTSGRANASGVPWTIGLSRFNNTTTPSGYYKPSYSSDGTANSNNRLPSKNRAWVDFGCARDKLGNLQVIRSAYQDLADQVDTQSVKYWLNASSSFAGAGPQSLIGVNFTDVRFTASGERMKLEIYDAGKSLWAVVTEFNPDAPDNSQFGPVHQACWCLHPVLGVFSNSAGRACTLQITAFDTPPPAQWAGYDPKKREKGGWYENMTLLGIAHKQCFELESRPFNTPTGANPVYIHVDLDAAGYFTYEQVMILEPSQIYTPTPGLSARHIFGFNSGLQDVAAFSVNSKRTFESDFAPTLASSMAMFVRLNNFGQNVINSLNGNQSKILSHLPRFDNSQSTGRLYFEPNSLVWLDLSNPAEMHVNEFDISFSYINEQYATVLTGQSIVCLMFREKPRSLMA